MGHLYTPTGQLESRLNHSAPNREDRASHQRDYAKTKKTEQKKKNYCGDGQLATVHILAPDTAVHKGSGGMWSHSGAKKDPCCSMPEKPGGKASV